MEPGKILQEEFAQMRMKKIALDRSVTSLTILAHIKIWCLIIHWQLTSGNGKDSLLSIKYQLEKREDSIK